MSERIFLILSHGIFPSKERREGNFIYGDDGYIEKEDVMKNIPDNVELYLLTEYGCKALASKKLDHSIKSSFQMYGVDLLHNTGFKYSHGYKFLDSCKLYNPGNNYVDVMISLEADPETWNIWELGSNGYVEFGNNYQRPSRPTFNEEEGYNKPLSRFLESLGGQNNIILVQCCLPYITREYGWDNNELSFIQQRINEMEELGRYNLSIKQYDGNVQPHTRGMTRASDVQPYGSFHPEDWDQTQRDTGRGLLALKDYLVKQKVINNFKSCRNNNESEDCLESIKHYFSSLFTLNKSHAEGKKKKTLKLNKSFKKKKTLKKKKRVKRKTKNKK